MNKVLKPFILSCVVSSLISTCKAEFAFTLKGGIDPTFFTSQSNIYAGVTSPDCGLATISTGRKFTQLFNNPGYGISLELAYSGCGSKEVFGEFCYRHHNGVNKPFTTSVGSAPLTISTNLGGLNILGGFVGFRYFFAPYNWQRMSFFVGGKVGVNHYSSVSAQPLALKNATTSSSIIINTAWFDNANTLAGGLQMGFDLFLCDGFSLFGNAEIVAGSALYSKPIIELNASDDVPVFAIIRQTRGVLFSFPFNIGLRYCFG